MRITVFTLKGGQGKTSISLALALLYDFLVVTNDEYSPIDKVLSKGQVKHLKQNESLPPVPADVDLIFDFGGYPDGRVLDALACSDWVIIPVIYDSPLEMQTAIKTIREIEQFNKNILLVVNRTHKGTFEAAKTILDGFVKYPLFEVKQSTAFSKMVTEGKSIRQLMDDNFLLGYHYKVPLQQVEAIKSYMDKG